MTGCIFQSSDRRDKGKGASRFRACSVDLGRCMSLCFYCRLSMYIVFVNGDPLQVSIVVLHYCAAGDL